MVDVAEVTEVDDRLAEAVAGLVRQLSSSAAALRAEHLAEIVASPTTRLLVATEPDTGAVLGTLTLAVFRIPTGVRAWIEDVVTDVDARGQGVAEALSRRALELAGAAGARTVELTSRPSREAANRLYRRLGFAVRDTNVYRIDLRGGPD